MYVTLATGFRGFGYAGKAFQLMRVKFMHNSDDICDALSLFASV